MPVQATYPLDTLRLRLAVDPGSRSVRGAAAALMREGSHGAFFRGLGASLVGALCTLCSHGVDFGGVGSSGELAPPLMLAALRCACLAASASAVARQRVTGWDSWELR